MGDEKRWKAVLTYRSQATGLVPVEHEIEELEELHEIVERGPDWNALDSIVITLLRHHDDRGTTIEETEDMPIPGTKLN